MGLCPEHGDEGQTKHSAMRLCCCPREAGVQHPTSVRDMDNLPPNLILQLPCEVVPRKAFLGKSVCFQTEFASRSGMAFLIPLPGVTLSPHLPHSFWGAQCLQLGRCLAEDRPRCEGFPP